MGVIRDQFGNPKKEQSQNLAENLPLKKVIDNYIRSKYAKFKNPGKHSKQILQSVPFYLCTLTLLLCLSLSLSFSGLVLILLAIMCARWGGPVTAQFVCMH